MATKDEPTTSKAAAKAPAKAADPTPAETKPNKHMSVNEVREVEARELETEGERVSTCVVNDGRGMHVGNAVNGLVCSYHAMHYDSHGNRR